MIGRRGFLKAIGIGVLGLSLALRPQQPPMAVDFAFTPEPISDDVLDRYIRPAVKQMADEIDASLMRLYADAKNNG